MNADDSEEKPSLRSQNVGDRKTHKFKMFRNTSRIIDGGLRHVQHQRTQGFRKKVLP